MPFFVFIDPSRTRPGTVKHFHSITYVARELGSNTRPQKSMRILRRLIRVLRLETWDSAGACEPRARRHRRERKALRAILELSDAKFAEVFGVILMFQNQGFLPQNLRFELWNQFTVHSSLNTKKIYYNKIKIINYKIKISVKT